MRATYLLKKKFGGGRKLPEAHLTSLECQPPAPRLIFLPEIANEAKI